MKRLTATGLVLPLVAFVVVTFVFPLVSLFSKSVYDSTVSEILPSTTTLLSQWSGAELPEPQVFESLALELIKAREVRAIGKLATRVNRIESGSRSLLVRTASRARGIETEDWRTALMNMDERWGELAIWQALQTATHNFTARHFLQAVDLRQTSDGSITWVEEEERIYLTLFMRTLMVSLTVTLLCLCIGYPMAFAIATGPKRVVRLLLFIVLIPFWTSLLIRTTSWIALLQKQGVLNDLLVWIGIIGDAERLTMIHNMTGTLVAMTQVLLPFMILPLYSVMQGIPETYTRAASSLGANPWQAFWRVYWPQSLPGIAAGSMLVCILSIGYYITPALVGGAKGQLISNLIAYHLTTSLNWGLAAALSAILLVAVILLYLIFAKFIGIERLKLS